MVRIPEGHSSFLFSVKSVLFANSGESLYNNRIAPTPTFTYICHLVNDYVIYSNNVKIYAIISPL